MATFTTKKKGGGRFPGARILRHPVLVGAFIAAALLLILISRVPVNTGDSDKLYILLTISSALMAVMLFVIHENLAKKAESDLQLQESIKAISDYKHALDESAIVVVTDQKGVILHANDNFCRISRYNREELIGQEHCLVNSAHHSKEFMRHLWVTITNGEIWRGEMMNRAKDGTIYWVDATIVPFLDEKGMPYQYMAIKSDITQRKAAEEAKEQSMANLSAIIEHTDSSIYSLDANYRYIAFNQILSNNLKKLYGLEIKQGDHVFAFLEKLEPTDAKRWKNKYSRALKGETIKFETEFDIGDFKKVVDFSIYPIWQNKAVIGLSCFTRDITEQKREEAKNNKMTADLIQRNKDLEQFSYIVSHNLRGPVANILGLSNLIKEISLSRKEKEKTRNYLFEAVKQLDVVITDLNQTLDIKRNIQEKKEEIIFSELMNGIRSGMRVFIEKRQASILTDFSDVQRMLSVRSYIQNVFYNLVSNSLKYARPGIPPVIRIKSECKADTLFLHFSDNGQGIDLELCKDKLFGLYQRFHADTEGKGMGLFMVKTQVEAMGGKVSLTSEVSRGTEVVVEFPFFRASN